MNEDVPELTKRRVGNEVTGEEGTVLRVDKLQVRVKFNDMDSAEDYYLNEKCLVRWPK